MDAAPKKKAGQTCVWPASALRRALVDRVGREERGPVQELVAYAAFEIFSAATLTRFEIGAKASL